jgi:hypothetical protein
MFNANDVMASARDTHEHLAYLIPLMLNALEATDVDGEQRSERIGALLNRMAAESEKFAPPIVSSTLTFLLIQQLESATRNFGHETDVRERRLLETTNKAIDGLGRNLLSLLQEEGWTKAAVGAQMSALSDKLVSATAELIPASSRGLYFHLVLAISLDKYSEFLTNNLTHPETKTSIDLQNTQENKGRSIRRDRDAKRRRIGAYFFGAIFALTAIVGASQGQIGLGLLFAAISAFMFYSGHQHLK